jgi:hypothetical protein
MNSKVIFKKYKDITYLEVSQKTQNIIPIRVEKV